MHSYFGGENIFLQMVSWKMETEMGCGWNCPLVLYNSRHWYLEAFDFSYDRGS